MLELTTILVKTPLPVHLEFSFLAEYVSNKYVLSTPDLIISFSTVRTPSESYGLDAGPFDK